MTGRDIITARITITITTDIGTDDKMKGDTAIGSPC